MDVTHKAAQSHIRSVFGKDQFIMCNTLILFFFSVNGITNLKTYFIKLARLRRSLSLSTTADSSSFFIQLYYGSQHFVKWELSLVALCLFM